MTDTSLDSRARSLYSWDARIRLLEDYDRVRAELASVTAQRDRALSMLNDIWTEDAVFVEQELAKARAEWAKDPTWHPAPHRVDGVLHLDHIGQTCEQYAAGNTHGDGNAAVEDQSIAESRPGTPHSPQSVTGQAIDAPKGGQ